MQNSHLQSKIHFSSIKLMHWRPSAVPNSNSLAANTLSFHANGASPNSTGKSTRNTAKRDALCRMGCIASWSRSMARWRIGSRIRYKWLMMMKMEWMDGWMFLLFSMLNWSIQLQEDYLLNKIFLNILFFNVSFQHIYVFDLFNILLFNKYHNCFQEMWKTILSMAKSSLFSSKSTADVAAVRQMHLTNQLWWDGWLLVKFSYSK